jgi:hypothetical protein
MANRGTWKIEIGTTTVASYTEVVRGENVGGGPNFMAVDGYGADNRQFINLGNNALTRAFVITQQWDDNKQSVDWYLNGAQALNGVADVTLTHLANDGTEAVYLIAGAQVILEVEEPINVTTTTHLKITGGTAVLQA